MSAVLGINPGFGGFNYHDPSACLVVDGRPVAAVEEERFTRVKSAPGVFPARSVAYCLEAAGMTLADLDAVAVGYSSDAWLERLPLETRRLISHPELTTLADTDPEHVDVPHAREALAAATRRFGDLMHRTSLFETEQRAARRIAEHLPGLRAEIRFVRHHRAHAASAVHPSGFRNPTAVVLDGLGELECGSAWAAGPGGALDRFDRTDLPNSLGYFYAAVTEYLGFRGWEGEGKTMALAPYGRPDPAASGALDTLVHLDEKGYDVSALVLPCLTDQLSLDTGLAVRTLSEVFQAPPRRAGDDITPHHENIAWAAQHFLEEAVTGYVRRLARERGPLELCFAGGVALNCKLNLVLRTLPEVERLYVTGACADTGLALGAALDVAARLGDSPAHPLPHLALGPAADTDPGAYLTTMKIPYERPADVAREVAQHLADGRVVMWYQGRAEFGPRALGSRSILADPRREDMRVLVNDVVKHRELWRPFGPSVLAEEAPAVLEDVEEDTEAPYMVVAYRVREEWAARIPAVVHTADNTTRPQLVRRAALPEYHAVISAFHRLTGVPLVLNTSFNDKNEPLVRTVAEAVRHFFSSAADVLVLDGTVVRKDVREAAPESVRKDAREAAQEEGAR
ncbi:carbamoyltransferase family protein [Streptomyces varsoviensis]|nr:carbamoyltransferase C-terminal domain-containing protein [Streptomyces varsoviensis]